MLREAVAKGTELGKKAKAVIDSGHLVSDEIMIGIIREVLQSDRCVDGFILDGFPRTIPQAEGLTKLLAELHLTIAHVINLRVNENVVVERLGNRLTCKKCAKVFSITVAKLTNESTCPNCGGELYLREDDKPETVRKRLEVYNRSTAPVQEYYRTLGLLRDIDGSGSVDHVNSDILAIFGHR
jgi:adenylate kinase